MDQAQWSTSLHLTSLSEREAITDALLRCLIGFDENNLAMFNSSFAELDITFTIGDNEIKGIDDIRNGIFATVGSLDTTHTISNVRIQWHQGSSNAHLACNAIAQHSPAGKGTDVDSPKYMSGSRYSIDLVQEESNKDWKIKTFAMKIVWLQGDASVMKSA